MVSRLGIEPRTRRLREEGRTSHDVRPCVSGVKQSLSHPVPSMFSGGGYSLGGQFGGRLSLKRRRAAAGKAD